MRWVRTLAPLLGLVTTLGIGPAAHGAPPTPKKGSAEAGTADFVARPVEARPARASDLNVMRRTFATPGDPTLKSAELTLMVRRQDGYLTELWRNRPFLPTAQALGTESDLDALWQLHQVASVGDRDHAFVATSTKLERGGIEIEAEVTVSGQRLLATTRIELHPTLPKALLRTRFREANGGAVSARLGDALRWGNLQYHVSGLGVPRMSYRGKATWVGRRGAQGDLLLRPTGDTAMHLDYRARIRGFQGPIKAHYTARGIPRGGELVATRELSFEPLPIAEPQLPRGEVVLSIRDERGAKLAAKVRVDKVGSAAPVFDEDGGLEGADRFAWTGNGELSLRLHPGRYRLLVTAGPERDAERFEVTVKEGVPAALKATLPRVVSTPGWVGADLHLHQSPSVDADISLAARVVSIAAEGVELAAATDHYAVTDLEPVRRALAREGVLATALQTLPGTEVSTLGARFGHFNVFPLKPGQDIIYRDTTPRGIFEDVRRKAPQAVLQVNHPRWDPIISYFSAYQVSEQTGLPGRPGYDPGFDTLEVYNGDDARDLKRVRPVLKDWLTQLGLGRRIAATGSSDSHKLAILDPGLPRTYLRCGPVGPGGQASDDTDVKAKLSDCMAALKAGRAIVTSGPFIHATVDGRGPGETVKLTSGAARFSLDIEVDAAPWISVSQVEVLAGSRGERLHFELVKETRAVTRYRRRLSLTLPQGADFVVVLAQGSRGLPNASREYTVPFAFTNPIWLER
ncbi:MAG: CehA/McbA family metallohydrolase [Polyangiaceae bacterium]|nr:CehA/McbA family metallohydrolase [Polyangiaceae bacterium]MCW5790094.1 CehA/McbA family metallohydrolase [Polyangiaceae bacterium]